MRINRLIQQRIVALIASMLIALSANAQNITLPDMGDPSQSVLERRDEQRLGREILRRLRSQGAILDDVQLTEYLNSVGQRLAAYTDYQYPFTFFWVRNNAINAFSAPGALIGIHTGLMLMTNTEDELAGVVAHEIAHTTQHHISRMMANIQQMSLPMMAALIASVAVAALNPQAGSAALAGTLAAGTQNRLNFTRTHEQEADRVGTRLMTQAGFDPNGMMDFFNRLASRSGATEAQWPEYLRTHPLPINRQVDIQHRVTHPRVSSRKDEWAYQMAKARLTVLTATDIRALIREFEAQPSSSPVQRYGYALALRQAGRFADAQREMDALLKKQPDPLEWRIERAELALLQGRHEEASRLFEAAQQIYGDDFRLAMHYGQALATQGNPQLAMQVLQPHLNRRQHPDLFARYAQAAQRAGDVVATHAALAEYHYLLGELTQAIEQAELGLKQVTITPYQQARLQKRLQFFVSIRTHQ